MYKDRFQSQSMDKLAMDEVEKLRDAFTRTDDAITGTQANFDPRMQAMARTHLEIAAMCATKMISHAEG